MSKLKIKPDPRSQKLKQQKIIGITIGDPAGVGPEVIAKALRKSSLRRLAHFKIIGDKGVYQKYSSLAENCSFINPHPLFDQDIKPGRPNRQTTQASWSYLKTAVDLLKNQEITALVTGPISKEGICSLGHKFKGHTEYLAQRFKLKKFGMMFVSPSIKTMVVTRHIPLKRVSRSITKKNISEAIELAHMALREYFKIPKPRIAVCGLNPHAGEGGAIGNEENTMILPAIQQARKRRIHAHGPFPADTVFAPARAKEFDVIIAMYHDQGLIAPKTVFFSELVNLTLGLPFIRTSPAHGTAFNIAGHNKADPSSMVEAIRLAAALS